MWHDGDVTIGKGRRPRDTNQLAKFIVDVTTGEVEPPNMNIGKNPIAVERGRRGGIKGGKARADALSARKRKQIAKKAAESRWKRSS
jgi:hypothetical protein